MKRKSRLLIPFLLCILLIGSLAYGGWSWYDTNVDRSGWTTENGLLYYQDFRGQRLAGWQQLEDGQYYFREDGSALTDWQEMADGRRYFGNDGKMALQWQTINENRYYFGDDGIMRSGWLELEGQTFYLPEGMMATLWQTIDGKQYYFTEGGLMALGFASIEGNRYYFGDNGVMVTGEAEFMGNRYFFNSNGILHTGWLETKAGMRYYLPEGALALGWQTLENGRYFFREDGTPVTGWHQEGEYRYYFQADGTVSAGPTEIDGQLHHFAPDGKEVVLVNANIPVPDWYEADLKKVVAHHQADARCYDALIQMLAGCEAAGIEYEFNSAYRTVENQKEILWYRTQSYMESYELPYAEARARALRTVALPGTSEHHLGLAVDLLGEEAKAWFQEHCWDYGFIVRYRDGKERWTGIADEDWHFRYVGREIALELKENGLSLEEYLGAEPVKPWME